MTASRRSALFLCVQWLFFLVSTVMVRVSSSPGSTQSSSEQSKRDTWYTRYPAYPPYCSTPDEMAKRVIPPLPADTSAELGGSKLVHVTAIFRHGARTPWSGDLFCWENYTTADTGVWDCDLTTTVAPPSPKRVQEEEQDTDASQQTLATVLFEKRYNALMDVEHKLSNSFRGTCQLGQLLLQGYEQELANGQHMRDAYFYSSDAPHDERMKLVDTASMPWENGNLYYRVDDDQRTVMSGQVLIRGMMSPEVQRHFEKHNTYPVLPLHTADRPRDILGPNEFICPRLTEIRERFERSSTFLAFNSSDEAHTLRRFTREKLKIPDDRRGNFEAVDCLMTTICTDRQLPDAVNDYKGEQTPSSTAPSKSSEFGTDLFQRLYDFEVQKTALLYTDNDSEYAKFSMAPLWSEIMTTINGVVDGAKEVCCPRRAPSKLALFSAHDTTVMPLLASLGPNVFDGRWAPYASMVVIEIHENNIDGKKMSGVFGSNHAFRLVYNGQVLTHLIDGCPKESQLCDVRVLKDRVAPFASLENWNCTRRHPIPETQDTMVRAHDVLSSPGGIVALALLVLGSAVFGALATYLSMAGPPTVRRRRHGGRSRLSQTDYEEDGRGSGVSMTFQNSVPPDVNGLGPIEAEGLFT